MGLLLPPIAHHEEQGEDEANPKHDCRYCAGCIPLAYFLADYEQVQRSDVAELLS